jgi:hypothetical protein
MRNNACAKPLVPVFYFITPERNQPVHGFFAKRDSASAIEDLATLLEKHVKQENLRALRNARSPLNGKLRLSIIRVEVEADADGNPVLRDGKASIKSETEIPESTTGPVRLPVGQRFRLKVTNTSDDKDLRVAILALGTSSSVILISPRGVAQDLFAGKSMTSAYLTVDKPTGLESYLAIAYTPATDAEPPRSLRILAQEGCTKSKGCEQSLGVGRGAGGVWDDQGSPARPATDVVFMDDGSS